MVNGRLWDSSATVYLDPSIQRGSTFCHQPDRYERNERAYSWEKYCKSRSNIRMKIWILKLRGRTKRERLHLRDVFVSLSTYCGRLQCILYRKGQELWWVEMLSSSHMAMSLCQLLPPWTLIACSRGALHSDCTTAQIMLKLNIKVIGRCAQSLHCVVFRMRCTRIRSNQECTAHAFCIQKGWHLFS